MKSLKNFLVFIPDSSSSTIIKVYLPTYAMGLHAQLQLYGTGALLHRVEMLSKNSALLDVQRLNLGHFWGVAAQNLAIVGRVWAVCRNLLMGVQICYHDMFRLLTELQSEDKTVEMPENLFSFMPEDLVLQVEQTSIVDTNKVKSNVESNEDSVTVDSFLDIGEPVKREMKSSINEDLKKRPNTDTTFNLAALNKKRKNDFVDDGEPVNREMNCSPGDQEKRPVKDKNLNLAVMNKRRKMEVSNIDSSDSDKSTLRDLLSDVHSLEQLKDFLKSESESRKVSRKTSFSHKINQESWKLLKKEVLANFISTKPKKSLKLCRRLIRNAVK